MATRRLLSFVEQLFGRLQYLVLYTGFGMRTC